MYAALVVPVLLLAALFSFYFGATLRKKVDVSLPDTEKPTARDILSVMIAIAVIAAIPLSIVGGVATLSEAAGVGVFGSLLVMGFVFGMADDAEEASSIAFKRNGTFLLSKHGSLSRP